MRHLLLILLTATSLSAQTVTISARNWGPDSLARDNAIAAYFAAFAESAGAEGDVYWLAQYEYTLTDSAVSVYDLTQRDPRPLLRYYNPTAPEPTECAVSPVWCTVSKHSPAKVKYAKFSTWAGGPEPTKVQPIAGLDKARLKANITSAKAKVEILVNDGKDWKDKAGKTLTAKEKRAAAWKVATGKAKPSDYTKTAK